MYGILFHVCWLALIEIIFYFEYIGPLETTLFKNSIQRLLDENTNNNDNTHTDVDNLIIVNPYNQTEIIYLNQTESLTRMYKDDVDNAENKRLHDNSLLYENALYWWVIFFSMTLVISFICIYIHYYRFNQNKKNKLDALTSTSELKIEMVEQRDLNYFFEDLSETSDNPNNKNIINNINKILSPRTEHMIKIDEEKFFNIKDIKKKCAQKTIHYLCMGGFILGFEYLFFTYIILNYKVISDEELTYLLSTLINPLLNNVYSNYI